MSLDESERALIAATLIESLDPEAEARSEEAWEHEIEARLTQIDSGKVQTIPWTEARKQILDEA